MLKITILQRISRIVLTQDIQPTLETDALMIAIRVNKATHQKYLPKAHLKSTIKIKAKPDNVREKTSNHRW